MITKQQFSRFKESMTLNNNNIAISAIKSGISEKTARKYRDIVEYPLEKEPRNYRTREDPLGDLWPKAEEYLNHSPSLEAKFLFLYLLGLEKEKYNPSLLRTFQRRVRDWRIENGRNKATYFPQIHIPGRLCQSDFSSMTSLGITINEKSYPHMIFHCVLTYSNYEYVQICKSESFESLSSGFQNAMHAFGGLPEIHQTDQLSAAVTQFKDREAFTKSYLDLMGHYGVSPQKIQVRKPNENGDVEKSHDLLKKSIEQHLLLRCSRDFKSEDEYRFFLNEIVRSRNQLRRDKFIEEKKEFKALPSSRVSEFRKYETRVSKFSTINLCCNTYSINSKYIDVKVQCFVYADYIKVFFGEKLIATMQRQRGKSNVQIDYRDIIDDLVRKPGAFANYKYKTQMFPSTNYRILYDNLLKENPLNASREYLKILQMSVEHEAKVSCIIKNLLSDNSIIDSKMVFELLENKTFPEIILEEITVCDPDLCKYDILLEAI